MLFLSSRMIEDNLEEHIKSYMWNAYPNPALETVTFRFSQSEQGPVKLVLRDLSGKVVATILDETLKSGEHTRKYLVDKMTAGMYFYTLTMPGYQETKKLTIH